VALRVLLPIAWRSVLRNARHSIGSALAIAVGFVALSLSSGYLAHLYGDQTDRFLERFMVGEVLVERTHATEMMLAGTGEEMPKLRREEQAFVDRFLAERADEVEVRARFLYAWGLASTGKASTQFLTAGYDVAEGTRLRRRFAWDTLAGRPLHRVGPSSVVLGKGLAALLDCALDPALPTRTREGFPLAAERPFRCRRPRVQLVATTAGGRLNAIEPEIVGIVDGGLVELDRKYSAMPLSLVQRLVDTDEISLYSVGLRDRRRGPAFARELTAAARAAGIDVAGRTYDEHFTSEENRRGRNVLFTFRRMVGVVVVVIAGLAVLTTMAKAVAERTREIGTLRSMGFLRRHVVALFALEAGLLAAMASAVGLVATLAISAAVNRAAILYGAGLAAQPMVLRIAFVPATYAGAAAFLAAVAAAAAVVPARRAARAPIPDALAHV